MQLQKPRPGFFLAKILMVRTAPPGPAPGAARPAYSRNALAK